MCLVSRSRPDFIYCFCRLLSQKRGQEQPKSKNICIGMWHRVASQNSCTALLSSQHMSIPPIPMPVSSYHRLSLSPPLLITRTSILSLPLTTFLLLLSLRHHSCRISSALKRQSFTLLQIGKHMHLCKLGFHCIL